MIDLVIFYNRMTKQEEIKILVADMGEIGKTVRIEALTQRFGHDLALTFLTPKQLSGEISAPHLPPPIVLSGPYVQINSPLSRRERRKKKRK